MYSALNLISPVITALSRFPGKAVPNKYKTLTRPSTPDGLFYYKKKSRRSGIFYHEQSDFAYLITPSCFPIFINEATALSICSISWAADN
jgi:hypothetical protein